MIQGLKRVAYRNDKENPHSYLSKESHATNWVVKRKTNGGGEEDAACWGGCPWRGWQNKPPSVFLVLIERLEFCISSTMDTWASHRRRASCPSYKLSYQSGFNDRRNSEQQKTRVENSCRKRGVDGKETNVAQVAVPTWSIDLTEWIFCYDIFCLFSIYKQREWIGPFRSKQHAEASPLALPWPELSGRLELQRNSFLFAKEN